MRRRKKSTSENETAPWPEHLRARLEGWRADGLERRLRLSDSDRSGTLLRLDARDVVSFGGNDYLGLASHPALLAAGRAALERSGAGARASPLVVGHRVEHAELERRLAVWKNADAALVFPSGFQASLATLSALAGPDDSIVLDRLSHACLLDGARLSGARVRVFKHNDATDLRELLAKETPRRCIVAAESVYSMDGDVAPLAELHAIATEAGALLLIDEAHATGVMGAHGRGLLETVPLAAQQNVIALGTLSKALGSQGGYIAAARAIVDSVVHAGRAYLFSTALSPVCAAAALAALDCVEKEPERRRRVLELAARLAVELDRLGLQRPPTKMLTPIVPIVTGDERRTLEWSQRLLNAGIFVPAIRFPTVRKGEARLRVSLSAEHTDAQLTLLLEALKLLAARADV